MKKKEDVLKSRRQALCHCHTCRKLTGSAYATAFLVPDPADSTTSASPAATSPADADTDKPKADFKCTSKTSTPPRTTQGTHETGLAMTFYSCSKCPSTLFKEAKAGFPGVLIVFAGTLDADADGRDGLEALGAPQAELWVKYRLPWLREVEGAKQCQEFE